MISWFATSGYWDMVGHLLKLHDGSSPLVQKFCLLLQVSPLPCLVWNQVDGNLHSHIQISQAAVDPKVTYLCVVTIINIGLIASNQVTVVRKCPIREYCQGRPNRGARLWQIVCCQRPSYRRRTFGCGGGRLATGRLASARGTPREWTFRR